MTTSKDNRPLAERFDDPATGAETRERLAELGDMIGNYEPTRVAAMGEFHGRDAADATGEYEARIRKLYADLFG